jgi:Zn finger protein HypA/HybF involved in hydrogenase expression
LHWTRKGSPILRPGDPEVPPPKAIAEVWVPNLGQVRNVYRCPDCQGAFLEIQESSELTACPKCGGEQFQIDPAAEHIIVD